MAVELVPLCRVEVLLRDPIVLGDGPGGNRMIFEVESATVEGERLRGEALGHANADWLAVHGSVGTLDVRVTLKTHDGALVLVQYKGRVGLGEGPGSSPAYCAPLFETADERYAWLNLVQAVGRGRLEGNVLRYEWFEVR